VAHPLTLQDWRWVSFLHWRYPVEAVARLLPPGLTVDTVDGTAYVGLIPLLMDRVRPPGVPPVPWLSQFPETNVRTYVRGPDGRTGIWFFSLDAARLPVVGTARASYGLPYCWADMAVQRTGPEISYRSRRRWPGPRGAVCDARIRFGEPLDAADLSPLDHFLTARYRLYAVWAGRLAATDATHAPWPLHRAELLDLREDLLVAAGLPEPEGTPMVHASPGVQSRVGRWRRLAS
jgi:uncharacterized protein YqjF (DUF2071 family)